MTQGINVSQNDPSLNTIHQIEILLLHFIGVIDSPTMIAPENMRLDGGSVFGEIEREFTPFRSVLRQGGVNT